MIDQYIEFKKQRELGDILTDTFAFLRNQFKPLMLTFLKIVGPYLLVFLIAMSFYINSFRSLFNFNTTANDSFVSISMVISFLVFFISGVFAYTLAQSTVLHYIKSYANNEAIANFKEVRTAVYGSLLDFIGLGFLVGISIIAGLLACCIPGIFLYVPLALSFSIMVFNQKGATDSYSYSFTLIKDEWWITFASLFVVALIVGVAGYAFNLPATIYGWMKMGILSGEVDAENMGDYFADPVYIILSIISYLAQFLLNIISIIAGVFIYFNLNEKKNFTGTYERIQNLGENRD